MSNNLTRRTALLVVVEQKQNSKMQEIVEETKQLFNLAIPIIVTALIFYSRSTISMMLLGNIGQTELAAGSVAIAFANITGYSVLSGLALGMEPLCSQAFGSQQRPKLLSVMLHRSIMFLLITAIPISLLWVNLTRILLYFRQDPNIVGLAQTYLIFTFPDLFTNSLFHPIRIYLRAQSITRPITFASLVGSGFHLIVSFVLTRLQLGSLVRIAVVSAVSNLIMLVTLVLYVWSLHLPTWENPTRECLTGWKPLIRLSAPSCVSVCLEWWWYEIMTLLCGYLTDPESTVASMGVLIQTTGFIYIFPSSLSFAVSTRVGNELGANRPVKARLSAAVSMFLAAVIGVTAMSFAWLMRYRWVIMFTRDIEIQRLTSAVIPILGLCELGNCPQTVGCGVVRGSARPSVAANVNLGAFYLIGMPVAVGLGFWLGYGLFGFWFGLLSAQICCAGIMLYVVGSTDWNLQAEKAQTLMITPRGPILEKESLINVV